MHTMIPRGIPARDGYPLAVFHFDRGIDKVAAVFWQSPKPRAVDEAEQGGPFPFRQSPRTAVQVAPEVPQRGNEPALSTSSVSVEGEAAVKRIGFLNTKRGSGPFRQFQRPHTNSPLSVSRARHLTPDRFPTWRELSGWRPCVRGHVLFVPRAIVAVVPSDAASPDRHTERHTLRGVRNNLPVVKPFGSSRKLVQLISSNQAAIPASRARRASSVPAYGPSPSHTSPPMSSARTKERPQSSRPISIQPS